MIPRATRESLLTRRVVRSDARLDAPRANTNVSSTRARPSRARRVARETMKRHLEVTGWWYFSRRARAPPDDETRIEKVAFDAKTIDVGGERARGNVPLRDKVRDAVVGESEG